MICPVVGGVTSPFTLTIEGADCPRFAASKQTALCLEPPDLKSIPQRPGSNSMKNKTNLPLTH